MDRRNADLVFRGHGRDAGHLPVPVQDAQYDASAEEATSMIRAIAINKAGETVCEFSVRPVMGMTFEDAARATFAILNPGVWTLNLTFRAVNH